MIHVLANIIEVIVLPSGTDALLTVYRSCQARQWTGWVNLAQKYRLELRCGGVFEMEVGGAREVVVQIRRVIDASSAR